MASRFFGGDGKGRFGPSSFIPTAAGAYDMTVADFNLDGKLDVVTTFKDKDEVVVFLGDGTGALAQAGSWPSYGGPQFTLTADFNKDGKPDFAVTNYFAKQFTVYLNQSH